EGVTAGKTVTTGKTVVAGKSVTARKSTKDWDRAKECDCSKGILGITAAGGSRSMEFRQRGWRHRDRSASRVVRIGVFQKRFGMYLAMAIVLLAGIPRPIEAQVASVVDRIRPLGDGPVYFSYPARDGVRGDGRNLTLDLHDSDHDDGWKSDGFESGPV